MERIQNTPVGLEGILLATHMCTGQDAFVARVHVAMDVAIMMDFATFLSAVQRPQWRRSHPEPGPPLGERASNRQLCRIRLMTRSCSREHLEGRSARSSLRATQVD